MGEKIYEMSRVHSIASASTEDPDEDYSSNDSYFMERFRENFYHIERVEIHGFNEWFQKYTDDLLRIMTRIHIEPAFWESLSPAEKHQYE